MLEVFRQIETGEVYMEELIDIPDREKVAGSGILHELRTGIQELGLKDTKLQRKMMNFETRKRGKDNFTSARDMGELLEKIYLGEGLELSRTAAKEMFTILTKSR